jgi:hypothetical protein
VRRQHDNAVGNGRRVLPRRLDQHLRLRYPGRRHRWCSHARSLRVWQPESFFRLLELGQCGNHPCPWAVCVHRVVDLRVCRRGAQRRLRCVPVRRNLRLVRVDDADHDANVDHDHHTYDYVYFNPHHHCHHHRAGRTLSLRRIPRRLLPSSYSRTERDNATRLPQRPGSRVRHYGRRLSHWPRRCQRWCDLCRRSNGSKHEHRDSHRFRAQQRRLRVHAWWACGQRQLCVAHRSARARTRSGWRCRLHCHRDYAQQRHSGQH